MIYTVYGYRIGDTSKTPIAGLGDNYVYDQGTATIINRVTREGDPVDMLRVAPLKAGSASFKVYDSAKDQVEASASATIIELPFIARQPAAPLLPGGASYTMSIALKNLNNNPRYQWQESRDGTIWADISGATAISYTANALDPVDDGILQYRVIVTNNYGSTTSPPVTMRIKELLAEFTTSPINNRVHLVPEGVYPINVYTYDASNAILMDAGTTIEFFSDVEAVATVAQDPNNKLAAIITIAADAQDGFNGAIGATATNTNADFPIAASDQSGYYVDNLPALQTSVFVDVGTPYPMQFAISDAFPRDANFSVTASGPASVATMQYNENDGTIDVTGRSDTSATYPNGARFNVFVTYTIPGTTRVKSVTYPVDVNVVDTKVPQVDTAFTVQNGEFYYLNITADSDVTIQSTSINGAIAAKIRTSYDAANKRIKIYGVAPNDTKPFTMAGQVSILFTANGIQRYGVTNVSVTVTQEKKTPTATASGTTVKVGQTLTFTLGNWDPSVDGMTWGSSFSGGSGNVSGDQATGTVTVTATKAGTGSISLRVYKKEAPSGSTLYYAFAPLQSFTITN